MAIAVFKDLCLDATDPSAAGQFWAKVLNLTWEPDDAGEGRLVGPTPRHTIWVNKVPEPKTVKHRVHFDIYATSLADLIALGSSILLPKANGRTWTVMKDPEDGEYCAFLRTEAALPGDRLHGITVDSEDPAAQASWWAEVFGAKVVHHNGWSDVADVPGMPIGTMAFNKVPEPKTVKNRVHWDVTVSEVQPLVDAGARVLRPPGDDRRWHVLADPEGNEFCVFVNE